MAVPALKMCLRTLQQIILHDFFVHFIATRIPMNTQNLPDKGRRHNIQKRILTGKDIPPILR